MDQNLSGEGDLLLGDPTDLPLLAMPLTPRPIVEDVVPESSVGSPAGEPVIVPSDGMPDLSREGPFDVHQDALESGGLSTGVGQFAGLPISYNVLRR